MKINLLSYFINENTPVYGGVKDSIVISNDRSILNGDTSNNLSFKFPAHIGTHVDFPYHFSLDGKISNEYPPSFWVFNNVGFLKCSIDEFEEKLNLLDNNIDILILKTGFGKFRNDNRYWESQPVIFARFADILKSKFPKLRLFGFDMISLTSQNDKAEGKKAHLNFLIKNDILIMEDMNLENTTECPDKVVVSPLQIENADGVPCTIYSFTN